jgi:hypothetical protein
MGGAPAASRRRWSRAVLSAALAAALGACGGGPPETPRDALAALQAAIRAKDGAAIYDLTDGDSMSWLRGQYRERRARLAQGEPASEVVGKSALSAEEVTRGTDLEAVELTLSRQSPFAAQTDWFLSAVVIAEEMESPDTARLALRGADGVERTLWFVRERGGWRYDHYRSRRPW